MQVRLFGELEAEHAGVAITVRAGKQRSRPPGPAPIVTTEAGYALAARPEEVDVIRFEQLVSQGRLLAEAGQAADASTTLGQALGLRRGEPLADFACARFF